MKKQIVLATIATLATGSAYATKARMNALGQNGPNNNDRGSFYINDTRNVFRNAARINQMNNYVVTEWGNASDTQTSTLSDPRAEGGFFKNAGSFSYGVYLGSDITDQSANATAANGGISDQGYAEQLSGQNQAGVFGDTNLQDRSNDIDLFFGGDMGVEWGARVHYANNSQEQSGANPEAKQSTLGLGLGMVMGDLNAYINYVISDEQENLIGSATTGAKWEDDGSMNLGVGYNWMDFTFFVDYDKRAAEWKASSTAAVDTTEQTILTVGAGYTKEISSTSRMFTDISYRMTSAEDKDGSAATNNVEADRSEVPLTVGFETDATSWLSLRGSITQNVFINSNKYKIGSAAEVSRTRNNTTDVQAGATLNFGKLMIDGMIGTTNSARAATGATPAIDTSENGTLALDNMMTQVAVHYWF